MRNKLAVWLNVILILSTPYAYSSEEQKVLDKTQIGDLTESNDVYLQERKKKAAMLKLQISIAGKYGFNHGYMTEMDYLQSAMMKNKSYWDILFSFTDLSSMLSDGAAKGMYLIGGIVDEVDASIKSVNDELIITEGTKFKLREYPRLAPSPPHWVDYLFKDEGIDLSPPAKSVLPKNQSERDMWKRASDDGWERGVATARNEFLKRIQHLYADLIGTINYWYLVEVGMIKEVNVNATNYYLQHQKLEDGETLTFNPIAIKIQEQSEFITTPSKWHATANESPLSSTRSTLRDQIVKGNITLQQILDSDITIYTEEHEQLMEKLKDDQFNTLRSN
ncbi:MULTISPECIES: type IV secretory system conjugative DNA transfer family protein [Vibrio]|uniref:type IV secretory system conjugative DNA transfer family protein n=1 Tax=Vibrio TaxID=662 RepID=UPI0004DF1791|nr:type IV secretory system conjugative DNA transfer family protein [Vibrio parahaemolyticus]EGQ9239475.1 hypothetical protein [Vibrio vulnificus]EHD1698117.1 type IV secretion system DotC family protein [Vibrio vulnificus]EKZ9225846.1 type IV secretory system conjugative DNA transfer family protein [Vibrio vulnificus]ELC9582688.1 type IV secretory system conjugative DNA transfer family protein [Vibrio vulnificus]MCU8149775.1 type IV secretion system DotC family protein [Vibrio vulnificus]